MSIRIHRVVQQESTVPNTRTRLVSRDGADRTMNEGQKDVFVTDSKQPKKHPTDRSMSPALIRALDHPVRRQALRLFTNRKPEWSPGGLASKIPVPLGNLSYHMRVLSDLGVTTETRTEKVRGAEQHFYISNIMNNRLACSILAKTGDDDKEILGSS